MTTFSKIALAFALCLPFAAPGSAVADQPSRCQPVLAHVTKSDRGVKLQFDQKEFDRQYQQIIAHARSSGTPVPSVKEIQGQVQESAQSKLDHIFAGGTGPSDVTITISCEGLGTLSWKCTITIAL